MNQESAIRTAAGVAGAALVISTFLPWADSRAGWDLSAGVAALVAAAGLVAITVAVSGGRIGLFRSDVSFRGAADILAVVTTVVIVCVIVFDLPEGVGADVGLWLALLGAIVVAGVCGDYRPLRGDAATFPSLESKRE
jgi:hypothetical protein